MSGLTPKLRSEDCFQLPAFMLLFRGRLLVHENDRRISSPILCNWVGIIVLTWHRQHPNEHTSLSSLRDNAGAKRSLKSEMISTDNASYIKPEIDDKAGENNLHLNLQPWQQER
jgi:hypothetical protein